MRRPWALNSARSEPRNSLTLSPTHAVHVVGCFDIVAEGGNAWRTTTDLQWRRDAPGAIKAMELTGCLLGPQVIVLARDAEGEFVETRIAPCASQTSEYHHGSRPVTTHHQRTHRSARVHPRLADFLQKVEHDMLSPDQQKLHEEFESAAKFAFDKKGPPWVRALKSLVLVGETKPADMVTLARTRTTALVAHTSGERQPRP